jgi:hypothetical protein
MLRRRDQQDGIAIGQRSDVSRRRYGGDTHAGKESRIAFAAGKLIGDVGLARPDPHIAAGSQRTDRKRCSPGARSGNPHTLEQSRVSDVMC